MHAPPKARASSHSADRAARPPAVVQLDATSLLAWALSVARGVARDCKWIRRGSAEEEELEGVAVEALVEYMHRYDEERLDDPADLERHFKSLAGTEVRSRCRRHAERLGNGGVYRTTGKAEVRERCRVRALPMCRDCSDVALPWPEREDEGEPEEVPMPAGFEPHVVWLVNGAPKKTAT